MRLFGWMAVVAGALVGALLLGSALSCEEPSNVVVLYTSVDEPVAREIIKRFRLGTGLKIERVTDAEGPRPAGLAWKVLAEKAHPRADVYWGNEPFHTIELGEAGAFEPYAPATAKDLPERFRD